MLAQTNTCPVAAANSFRSQRDAEVWEKIKALLDAQQSASTQELADAVGLSRAAMHRRLTMLRDLEELRNVPPRRGSPQHAWALCTEADAFFGERIGPTLTKAVQMGYRRDPLVEALFGPAPKPVTKPSPFRRALIQPDFSGVNIDEAHLVMAFKQSAGAHP